MRLEGTTYRLGRTLHFDEKTFTCTGDPEATRMFTRDYRAPFTVGRSVADNGVGIGSEGRHALHAALPEPW